MNETVELEHPNKIISNSTINNSTYSPDEVITDYLHFFSGGRNDNMLKYAYLLGNHYFEQLVSECEDYYVCRDEVDTIQHNLDKFTSYLEGDVNFFEIGPGSEQPFVNKIRPIIQNTKMPVSYCAIDISRDFAEEAAVLVNKYFPLLSTSILVKDFVDISCHDFPVDKKDKVIICLGNTLGNFNERFVDLFVKMISDLLIKDDKFIFSVDCNQDQASIMRAYNNEYMSHLCRSVIRYANDKFSNIDWEKGFKFTPIWRDDTNSVEFLFCAEFDQIINIQGYEIDIKKDSFLYAGRSKKFSEIEINTILSKNNLVVMDKLNYKGFVNTYVCTKI